MPSTPVAVTSGNGWNMLQPSPVMCPSVQQRIILQYITQDIQTLTVIHAGGGVGKTFIIDLLGHHYTDECTLNVACFGSAAALLRHGKTHASVIKPTMFRDPNYVKRAIQQHGDLQHVVWDEFGCGGAKHLIDLERYCRIVKRNNRPWGGISITLCGDCLQTQPVKGVNIIHADVGRSSVLARTRLEVQNLLRSFKIFTESDLSVIERNDGCPEHLQGCKEFRSLPRFVPGGSDNNELRYSADEKAAHIPLSSNTVAHLMREVTSEEMTQKQWRNAIILCSSNRDRAMFNIKMALLHATSAGVPVAAWREPFHANGSDPFYSSRLHNMDRFPETFGIFAKDSPGMILNNIVRFIFLYV